MKPASWKDLLAPASEDRVLPWIGGKEIHSEDRSWVLTGRRPPEFGWYSFELKARTARLKKTEPEVRDPEFKPRKTLRGYVVGDRFIPDNALVIPDPQRLLSQTEPIFCVDPGLDRFARARAFRDREGRLLFLQSDWPEGPEVEVLEAYQDRKESVTQIPGVIPALDLAFRWMSLNRELSEEAAREAIRLAAIERERLEKEERLAKAMEDAGTGVGRRTLALVDFNAAAMAALALSGAELLDVRDNVNRNEKVVQYRYRNRRLECVVDRATLRVIDAGVCLDDHRGTKGDTFFTLESLPTVIGEALNLGKLVIWRHVAGDRDYQPYDDRPDDDDDDYYR